MTMVVDRRKKIENQSKFDFCLGGYIRVMVRVRGEAFRRPHKLSDRILSSGVGSSHWSANLIGSESFFISLFVFIYQDDSSDTVIAKQWLVSEG